MKLKKFLSCLLVGAIGAVGITGLTACKNEPETTDTKRMTVDINPSVEFILDSDDKVVSVTGMNDDGDLLISGEVFIGKTADEAAKLVVELATDSGYIVSGSVSVDKNNVNISISGYEEEVEELYNKVADKVNGFLQNENIVATVNKVEAMKEDALKELVAKCYPELSEDEINAMDNEELLNKLKLSRIECASLATEALRESYYKMKEYEFKFASYEKTKEIISTVDSQYQTFVTLYDQALKNYQDAIAKIEQAQYDNFVNPDSNYQKAVSALYDKKAEIIELENKIAEADEITKLVLQQQLTAAKLQYQTQSTALTTAKNFSETVVEGLVSSMRIIETSLINYREQFPEEIKSVLQNKTTEIETAVNTAKNNAFAAFEEKYGNQITAYQQELQARKNDLIAKNNANA